MSRRSLSWVPAGRHPDVTLSRPQVRTARLAVTLLFVTNGALLANILPRYPQIKDALNLTYLDFGAAVAAFPVGAIVFGLLAGVGIRRFGSARVAVVATLLLSLGMLCAGLAPSWILLASALFFAGAMDALTDVAQNAQGLRVQKIYGSSILNSFHAGWSVGAVLGGAMGAAAAALDIPLGIHLAFSGLVFTALSLLAYRFMLHGTELRSELNSDLPAGENTVAIARQGSPARSPKWIALAILAIMAIGGMIVEDAGITWSTFYLNNEIATPSSLVGLGLIAFLSAQFLGRITGDYAVNRFGQRAITLCGAAIMMLGMGVALAFPSTPSTIVGFATAGFGVATLIPAAMHAANELPGFRTGTGLTLVTWLMRIGAFSSPLIVGAIADQFGLRAGLLLVPLVGLIVVLLSPVFAKRL
ncbi:MFS transporter [Alpinimonas psychrophila]|uniref:MFS family permease n=1 Tax=Alpinimonas psychrophila TaxID=748908 RepID=A0A7W3JTU8_9MICO|nr:MFS transporter [Alpinimonas psychrophila]MBA8829103.1 MFS family permease [Alpinimonas psychrophila]